jgi:predicted transcriptional regulator
MKYRSRTELVSHILEAANGGATKTKIMYKAFLSYAQLKEYLNLLIENGLIDYDSTGATYRTSPKGLRYLGLYSQMDKLVLTPEQAK